jgi:hypothetical protein
MVRGRRGMGGAGKSGGKGKGEGAATGDVGHGHCSVRKEAPTIAK